MKLRLTAPGFETYTGQMGAVFFEDGLSTDNVLTIDALRIAGTIGAEWEDGSPANISQIYLNAMNTPAPVASEQDVSDVLVSNLAEAPKVQTYTEDQLAGIADKEGISGLRAIADPMGVKGQSIRVLIDGILKATGTQKVE